MTDDDIVETDETPMTAERMAREARERWEAIRAERDAVLREWLAAIRLEIEARGDQASLSTIKGYADAALAGEVPHWYTDEYRTS